MSKVTKNRNLAALIYSAIIAILFFGLGINSLGFVFLIIEWIILIGIMFPRLREWRKHRGPVALIPIEVESTENLARKAIEARRSQQYEVFRHITREDFESLFRPLDIHSEYSLDLTAIVGEENATKLMRQWYPEKWCRNCREMDPHPGEQCPQDYADNKAYLHNRKTHGGTTYEYRAIDGSFVITKSSNNQYYC